MTKQYNDELKRAPAGKKYIYVITETETGKMYIGQTRNFHKRMCSHRNCGYSQHSAIDRVIQEKGVDAFEYEVLELCTEDEADERERYWIEKTDSCNEQKGFNIFKGGQKSFSDESYAMLVEMLQQGMTLKDACDAMNTSSTSARREIKRRGTNLSEIRSLAAEHKHLRRKSAHRKEINITDVLKMYQDGMTSKEIASHYDMNPSAFYRRLKENGLSARAIIQPNYGTASTLFDKDKAISMRKDGYTAREIGATMGLPRYTVERLLRESGCSVSSIVDEETADKRRKRNEKRSQNGNFDYEMVIDFLREGYKTKEIADLIGMSSAHLTTKLKQNGFDIKNITPLIVCDETKETFSTIMEASKAYNINYSSLRKCFDKKQGYCGGYHWHKEKREF